MSIKKNIFIFAALSAIASISPSIVADVSQSDTNSTSIKTWDFPFIESDYRPNYIIDTSPDTRIFAQERIIQRGGFTFNELARSHRVHIPFDKNSLSISDPNMSNLFSLARKAGEGDIIVITGYASQESMAIATRESNIASERMNKVAHLMHEVTSVEIRTDWSSVWTGDPDDADRVEIFLIRRI